MAAKTQSDEPIALRVESRNDMESQLERAVDQLKDRAQLLGDRGILVTRHSARDFTVELHQGVPFGLTHELVEW